MNPGLERFLRDAHILARLVEQVLERGCLERVAHGDVTFDQLNILKFLNRPQPALVKDVAHFLNASYAAASKAVARLGRKGLVRCRTDARDRRAALVEVTAKGRSLIQRYEDYKETRLLSLLQKESPENLARGLEDVISVLVRDRAQIGSPCLGCGAYYTKACVSRAHGVPCAGCTVES